MENIVEEYVPFEHKNLEYINGSLNLARQQRQSGTLEGLMASTVIYTNLVEYLASNLLENLQQIIFLLTYHNFNGIFFVRKPDRKTKAPKTLGQLRGILTSYEFPDNSAFIALLESFGKTRNSIFHRLLTISKEDLDKGLVDQQFSDLRDFAEEILDKYNAITRGITATWYSTVKLQSAKQNELNIEDLKAQVSALLAQVADLQTKLSQQQEEAQKMIRK